MKMAFERLPQQLMTMIFVKLPVKYLLRCKCVRKSWCSLIKSPHFIRLHHRSSSSSSSPQFIIRRLVRKEEEPRHVLSFHSKETLADLGNEIHTPISTSSANEYSDDFSLSGSCDGLVCIHNHYDPDYFYDETDQILICNPATREFRSLFVPPMSDYHIDSVAFGSDPSTGQYKVVMIGVPLPARGEREAQVYDFSTDSWRETGIVIPDAFSYSRHAISLNGAFHWCPSQSDILTFHISDEVAGSIPMPDFFRASSDGKKLYVSSESQQLSLVIYDWEGRYEICVMTEYGVKESWTRLFQIGPLLNIVSDPLAFWDEQQQLLLQTEDGQLVSCDLQHQNHLRYFPIYGGFEMYPYSESLVSVHGNFGQY